MQDCSKALGDSLKRAREKMKLTQSDVAALVGVDTRTVLNIENYRGNPKFEVLYPIVRALNLDMREIFYPEMSRDSVSLNYLQQTIGTCTDDEAEILIPIVASVLSALRNENSQKIE